MTNPDSPALFYVEVNTNLPEAGVDKIRLVRDVLKKM